MERVLGYVMATMYLGFVASFLISANYPWEYKLIGIILLLFILMIPKPKPKKSVDEERKEELLNRIKASGLAVRIRSGSLHNDQIKENTHPMARWLVPPMQESEKLPLLRRLCMHLEWYLVPPGALYKEAGLISVGLVGMVVLVITLFVTGDPLSILLGSWKWLPFPLFALSFFAHAFYEQFRNRIEVLGDYIKEEMGELDQSPTRKEINEALVQSMDGGLHRDYNMDLIINQCDKVLDHYKHLPSMTVFMVLPVIMFIGINPFGSTTDETLKNVLFYGSIFAIVGLVSLLDNLLKRKSTTLQISFQERIEEANLAGRILLGETTKAQLKAHIPRLFQMSSDGISLSNLPTGEGAEVSADIICVALNLDWFLEHPKSLVRPMWITFPILFVTGAGFAASYVFSASVSMPIPIWAWVMLGIAGLAFWITLLQASVRMRAGSLALIEHLREGRS